MLHAASILPNNQKRVSYFLSVSVKEASRLIRCLLDLSLQSSLKHFVLTFSIISKLSNSSISQATFPFFSKHHKFSFLLKRQFWLYHSSNYRPSSNLITISEITKTLVLSRITFHMSPSHNFNPFQSAYRHHHLTETALLRITDSLRNICTTGHTLVLVSLDLSVVFDTFDHIISIDVLNRHFFLISDLTLSWFRFYLSQRSHFV